jgi:predicted MFS family arabinose efflux permease
MWRKMPMREAQRQTAYALDSVILELMFIGGPLVVSLVLLFSEARYGLLISAALILFGMTGFVRSGGIKLWGEVEQGVSRNWFGPLQSPGFLYSLLAMLFYGTATALAEMAMPIFATQMGQTSLVSLYYVVMSIASTTGCIFVGSHVFKRPVIEQLLIAGVIGVVTYGAMGMVTVFKVPLLFAVLCFFAGFSIGPFISLMFTVSMAHVPSQYATEAMTWVTTALLIGLGLGYAIAGGLSDRYGLRALLLFTLLPSSLAVACVWGIHTRLKRHDQQILTP